MAKTGTVRGLQLEQLANLPTVSATELKNKLGETLALASDGAITITRHNRPAFVVLPAADYENLRASMQVPVAALNQEFDALVARMNTPEAAQAVDALFAASPQELGHAAVKAARHA